VGRVPIQERRIQQSLGGMIVKDLSPRRVDETESDGRGIKAGWYATNKTGQVCSGPFLSREECQAHITEARTELIREGRLRALRQIGEC
jgi:hypothetical protein